MSKVEVKLDGKDVPDYPFIVYQMQAMRTAAELENKDADMLHAAMGIASEGGELLGAFKSAFAYGKELDLQNVIEEMGDLMWFIALMCHSMGITMDYVAVRNIEKLYARYPEKFTQEDAIARADKLQ
jgi:NTP pyrophosphatase (non-canonical NTP hydrolase)